MDKVFDWLLKDSAPMWLVLTWALLQFIFLPMYWAIYKDIFKGAWNRRWQIKNDIFSNSLSDNATDSMIAGQYMFIAREMIPAAWTVRLMFKSNTIDENMILSSLRARMNAGIAVARSDLSRFKNAKTGKCLADHLNNVTADEKIEFYAPIVAEVAAEGEANLYSYENLRLVILSEIDKMTSEARKLITHEKVNS